MLCFSYTSVKFGDFFLELVYFYRFLQGSQENIIVQILLTIPQFPTLHNPHNLFPILSRFCKKVALTFIYEILLILFSYSSSQISHLEFRIFNALTKVKFCFKLSILKNKELT